VPRGAHVYVGTTDTSYVGDLDEPAVTAEDVDYLLAAMRRTLPGLALDDTDIVGTWAGVRPLVHEEGKSPSEISRKDEVSVSPSGLVTIAGGKLTTYRRMAERVLETCAPALGRRFFGTDSSGVPLAGGDLGGADDLRSWAASTSVRSAFEGVPEETAHRLIAAHGSDTLEVVACTARPGDLHDLAPGVPITAAEIRHAVRREMARTLGDLLERRTPLALFETAATRAAAPVVADLMAAELGWSPARVAAEVAGFTRQCDARLAWRTGDSA
jgi:glycerol-3-phosphate dehydrogenase